MSTVTKRPTSGVGRAATNNGSSAALSSSPSSPVTPTATTTPNGHRSRPSRTGSILTSRAPATRRESLLRDSTDAELEARAEAIAAIDDLKARLSKSEAETDQYRKEALVLETRLKDSNIEHAKLEERLHEYEEQIESLSNSKRETARQMREMEAIYEAERSSMTKEKEEMANREEEMQAVIQRLKDSLSQRLNDDEFRSSRNNSNATSPTEGGSFAPPSSIQRSDSRNNSKILLQKDKLIESLRLELAEITIKLAEAENQGGGRLQEVERMLMEARMTNARLMEDNESYQLLLQEKTLNGDFAKTDFSYMNGRNSVDGDSRPLPANEDTLAALEGRSVTSGTTLADELGDASDDEESDRRHVNEHDDAYRRIESELRNAKDQNKALTLYINKIIERLLQHQEFEAILDQSSDSASINTNKELPPPPPGAGTGAGTGWLQRTKSLMSNSNTAPNLSSVSNSANSVTAAAVAANAAAAAAAAAANVTTPITAKAKRPRPMSIIPTAAGLASLHNDPDLAPRVPIGNIARSTSVRRARPQSEQYTGPGGAALVNQMYRGLDGQMSPTFNVPRRSQTFFASGALASPGLPPSTVPLSGRMSSSTGSQTPSAGNFPGMRSETSSVSNESTAGIVTPPSQSSPPQSLPATDKMTPQTQTTFAGNKPRPLRLVQDHNDAVNASKRNSWLPWAGGWGKKEEIPEN
ncbi:hypothetical protein CFIMG_002804RAa [Ceratocystis fimbriata CBS 114723]|uniref:M protein, serotype 2.1 n=2 Tax=Ceratocystis TaxID=5157 RepID=A0A0F8BTL5_CERFI|nr:hypothetical protein CFO_g1729 [Ceratocystis platani]PHH53952.1 hypothetical protein CFIMG_002804RAa [Ceratocystis fimbriata CBS 114723]